MISLIYWLLGGFTPPQPLISEMSIRPVYQADTDISPVMNSSLVMHQTHHSSITVIPA